MLNRLHYALNGIIGRLNGNSTCPSCAGQSAQCVDRKYFHGLLECSDCGLLYRYPYESAEKMSLFYQSAYKQSGLTTELPDGPQLAKMMADNFSNTDKDFSRIVRLLNALKLPEAARVLDFGANWGYGMYQFQQAGYRVVGYEISEPRASFAEKLDLKIETSWKAIEEQAPFDIAFSSHVLEHTPDPAEAIKQQFDVLAPGGMLVALFPHGSEEFRSALPSEFHKIWGMVHPVMLTDIFLDRILGEKKRFYGELNEESLNAIAEWDYKHSMRGTLSNSEFLLISRKPRKNGCSG